MCAFIVTLVKAELLLPLNKLWMYIGYLIGLVVSPIVLGYFFGLFTPIGAIIKVGVMSYIKYVQKNSYWKIRDQKIFLKNHLEISFNQGNSLWKY